jgi:hypothetical protein
MPALAALEPQAFAVGCRDVTTPGATPAGVARVDQFKPNPRRGSLVGNKELTLGVGPAVDFGSEVFPFFERGVSHVAQIFADDSLRPNFNRVADQCLGGDMQEVPRYGCLISGHPAEQASGGLGANGLDRGAGEPDARTTMIQLAAFEEKCLLIVRIGSGQEAFYAKVHAYNATCNLWFWDLDLVRENQIPLVAHTFDLGILPTGVRNPRANQFNWLPEYCDAFLVPREVTPVGGWYRRLFVDRQSPAIIGFGRFVSSSYLSKQRAGQLGWKLELLSHNTIELIVQLPGVQFLAAENNRRDPVQSRKVVCARSIIMRDISGKLDFDCPYGFQYDPTLEVFQNMSTTKGGAIPPTAKAVGFLAHYHEFLRGS